MAAAVVGHPSELVVSAYSAYGSRGASTKVRLYDWFDHLGWGVERHEYLGLGTNSARDLLARPRDVVMAELRLRRAGAAARLDVTIVSREASPLSKGRLEASLLSRARRGIFDFDDAVYLPASGPRRWLDQEKKTRRAVEASDGVIAGNDVLADWASQYSDRVSVIPSCVEPADYDAKVTWEMPDVPRLVWLGSPSTEQYVVGIAPALERVWRRTGAILTVISGPVATPRPLDRWSHFIRRVDWNPEVVRTELAAADAAIAPLSDDAYSRGKCAYKLLQYAAAALPIAGAPVGANRPALERFEGVTVERDEEWEVAVISLLEESTARRRRRGLAGVLGVAEHYSFTAWQQAWVAAVRGVGA